MEPPPNLTSPRYLLIPQSTWTSVNVHRQGMTTFADRPPLAASATVCGTDLLHLALSAYLAHRLRRPPSARSAGAHVNIDFINPVAGPGVRVAVELTEDALALIAAIRAALASAPPGLARAGSTGALG